MARTDEIIEAQQKAGTLVTVISQHRFDPATEATLAAIERGELGRLTSGIASIDWWRGQSYYDSGDWRGTWELDGGGALMNQGVHTVDLLVAALGRPVEVFAYTGTLAHERIEVEDVAVGVVRFDSGALGVLHATTAAYPGLSARLQVHGDRGSAVIDNDQLAFFHATPTGTEPDEKLMGSSGRDQPGRSARVPIAAPPGSDPGQLSDAHRLQYLNFLGALRRTEPAAGRPGDQPAVDRASSPARTSRAGAGPDGRVTTCPMPRSRIAANPIPYWSRDGRQDKRGGVRGGVPRLPGDRLHRRQGRRARRHDRGGVRRVDRRLRPRAVAEPVQLPVRRDRRHGRGGGAGQAVRRHPGRRWGSTVR